MNIPHDGRWKMTERGSKREWLGTKGKEEWERRESEREKERKGSIDDSNKNARMTESATLSNNCNLYTNTFDRQHFHHQWNTVANGKQPMKTLIRKCVACQLHEATHDKGIETSNNACKSTHIQFKMSCKHFQVDVKFKKKPSFSISTWKLLEQFGFIWMLVIWTRISLSIISL